MGKSQFSMWGWLLQRITGVLLTIGMIVHYLYLHFFTGGNLDFNVVAQRLHSPWWVCFDTCLLAVIIYHGLYGVLGIITDCNIKPSTQKNLNYLFGFAGIVLFLYGFIALLTFYHNGPVL